MCTLSVTTKYLQACHLHRNCIGMLTLLELCRNSGVHTQAYGRLPTRILPHQKLKSYGHMLGACHVVNLAVYICGLTQGGRPHQWTQSTLNWFCILTIDKCHQALMQYWVNLPRCYNDLEVN